MQERIKSRFTAAGFCAVGFLSKQDARFGPWYESWLKQGYQGEMSYLERNLILRQDPASIEPWGKSFICLAFPYFTQAPPGWEINRPLSRYAWGKDYHRELKKRVKPV